MNNIYWPYILYVHASQYQIYKISLSQWTEKPSIHLFPAYIKI